MRNIFYITGILSFVLLSSGCVSYTWVKPGSGGTDLQKQQALCEAEAVKNLPPDMEPTSEELSTSKDEDCKNHANSHSRKMCNQQQERTTVRYKDMNSDARDTLFNACMYNNGWTKIQIKN